jgi:D,D-heptose 1,7-bisphosphate phosphatase
LTRSSTGAPEQAVILIGGLGTRLGALTKETPKPMLNVGDRPFLDYMIENCVRFGFRRILLLAGYRSEIVERYVSETNGRWPADVNVVIEPAPRGTAGALSFAAEHLEETFLLLNGDSFFDTNWLDLMLAIGTCNPAVVMALRRVEDGSRYGVAKLQGERVVGFSERGDRAPGLINGGIYLMHRRILNSLPQEGSLESEVLPKLSAQGEVCGRVQEGFFVDIGIPEALAHAQLEMPKIRRRPAIFFDRDGTLNVDAGYTHRQDDLEFIPGAVDAIKRVNDLGFFAFLVTNQAGVAKGHFTEADVQAFHVEFQRRLRALGAHLDDIRYCPSHPDGSVSPYDRTSNFRKPAPGMLLDLLAKWPVATDQSILIGDKKTDVEAAEAAGLRGELYTGGNVDAFLESVLRLDPIISEDGESVK